jgi:hypothetical protein
MGDPVLGWSTGRQVDRSTSRARDAVWLTCRLVDWLVRNESALNLVLASRRPDER